jgi:hypothetical protein
MPRRHASLGRLDVDSRSEGARVEQKPAVYGYGRKSAEGFVPGVKPPARRPLKILAFDPSLRRSAGNPAIVEIVNERLSPVPWGGSFVWWTSTSPRACTTRQLTLTMHWPSVSFSCSTRGVQYSANKRQ